MICSYQLSPRLGSWGISIAKSCILGVCCVSAEPARDEGLSASRNAVSKFVSSSEDDGLALLECSKEGSRSGGIFAVTNKMLDDSCHGLLVARTSTSNLVQRESPTSTSPHTPSRTPSIVTYPYALPGCVTLLTPTTTCQTHSLTIVTNDKPNLLNQTPTCLRASLARSPWSFLTSHWLVSHSIAFFPLYRLPIITAPALHRPDHHLPSLPHGSPFQQPVQLSLFLAQHLLQLPKAHVRKRSLEPAALLPLHSFSLPSLAGNGADDAGREKDCDACAWC